MPSNNIQKSIDLILIDAHYLSDIKNQMILYNDFIEDADKEEANEKIKELDKKIQKISIILNLLSEIKE